MLVFLYTFYSSGYRPRIGVINTEALLLVFLKKLPEEPQRDSSTRTDRHAICVACTKQHSKITVYKAH